MECDISGRVLGVGGTGVSETPGDNSRQLGALDRRARAQSQAGRDEKTGRRKERLAFAGWRLPDAVWNSGFGSSSLDRRDRSSPRDL